MIKGRGKELINKDLNYYFNNIYYDLVSPSNNAIDFAIKFHSAKKIMFATDHPWIEMGTMKNIANNMQISNKDKSDIMGLNAIKFFNL